MPQTPYISVTIGMHPNVHNKMQLLMRQCGVNSIEKLFEQMIDELDWSINYSRPVNAALLANRAVCKAANSSKDSQGKSSRTGEQPD